MRLSVGVRGVTGMSFRKHPTLRNEGEVTTCVPHDRKDTCGDGGALFDSTVCPPGGE